MLAHVDDLSASGTRRQIDVFYEKFSNAKTGFSITKQGRIGIECKRYLGIEVERNNERGEFLLSNDHLIKGLLEKVGERIKGMPPEDVAMRDERLSNGDTVKDLDERKKQGLDKLPPSRHIHQPHIDASECSNNRLPARGW